jgi:hypothetical protein
MVDDDAHGGVRAAASPQLRDKFHRTGRISLGLRRRSGMCRRCKQAKQANGAIREALSWRSPLTDCAVKHGETIADRGIDKYSFF